MADIDPAQAQRVWQRVRGTQEENLQQLLVRLIRTAGEDAALYRQLAHKNSRFQRLWEEKQSQIRTLRGLYFIHAGTKLPPVPVNSPQGGGDLLIKSALGRQLQTLRAYDQQAKNEEFGSIFQQLRQDQQKHTTALLEAIGSMN